MAAGWVITTARPAIEIVALRVAPELGKSSKVTVADPVPEAAPETVIQLGRPEIAQGQIAVVWMLTVRLPPAATACNGTAGKVGAGRLSPAPCSASENS